MSGPGSEFDYVIAGAGSAGCTLAARLAEDPSVKVCLVFHSYDLAEFDARILRGVPVRDGRMEALPFRIHLPKKPGADSIYDNQSAVEA